MAELLPLIQETIAAGGVFTLYPKGVSMLPLLRQGKDAVELSAPCTPAIGDVILYRRDSGEFVLHRIIGQNGNSYLLCGDSQYRAERGIRSDQIIARVSAILREGVRIPADHPDYLRYLRKLPARRRRRALRAFLGKIKNYKPS